MSRDEASPSDPQAASPITRWLAKAGPTTFSLYSIVAAFTTYFCMYAFRKPFTAAEYDGEQLWGIGYKTVLVTSQVAGYTLSKFIGIKVISEMPAHRRALAIVGLIAAAELALLLFGIVPAPYNYPLLFLNGLPLGMVFGLVLCFLEGRQVTEALTAGLCASFILASGVVKSVGRTLIIDYQVTDYWMPFLTGLLFVPPLLLGVYLLNQIPNPGSADIELRNVRQPMTSADRRSLFWRHAGGLTAMVTIYILLTIIRSIRDDFEVEIWQELEYAGDSSNVYAWSALAVAFGALAINGAAILIKNNRHAFLGSFALIAGGFVLMLFSLWGYVSDVLSPFAFMGLVGLGAYVPYVAFHTTVFERFLAVFRERGNIGYLMYLADATGYLGYVGMMIAKERLSESTRYLPLFLQTCFWLSGASLLLAGWLLLYYGRLTRRVAMQTAPTRVLAESA